MLPGLHKSLNDAEPPLEFRNGFVNSLELLMLGQAQECAWQLVLARPSASAWPHLSGETNTYQVVLIA